MAVYCVLCAVGWGQCSGSAAGLREEALLPVEPVDAVDIGAIGRERRVYEH